jgi:hypothetical protein
MAIATTATTPLAGTYSLQLTKSAANAQYQGFISGALTIDREDTAKVLYGSFSYEVVSGTVDFSGASTQTYEIWIYNTVSGAWTQPAGYRGMNQSSGIGKVTFSFQTDGSTANNSYKIAVITQQTGTGAIVVEFDSFQIGPSAIVLGAAMTDWVKYTPSTTAFTGFGTVSGINIWSRRDGDSLEVQGYFTSGTPTAVTAVIPLGFNGAVGNVSIDSTKIAGNVAGSLWIGASNSTYFSWSVLASPSTSNLNIGFQSSTTNALGAVAGSAMGVISGTQLQFYAKVPITGWSSNVQMSSDTDTRVVAFSAYDGASITATNTTVLLPIGTTDVDTHSARSSNTYVIPVSGFYRISGKSTTKFSIGNASFNHALLVYKNGTSQNGGDYGNADGLNNSGNEFFFLSVNSIFRLNAGDVIDLRYFTNYTGTATTYLKYCSIERISGPSVIAATETVAASYLNSGGTTVNVSTVTTISSGWSIKLKDTHNAFSSGIFTVPVSGSYAVSAGFILNSAANTINGDISVFCLQSGSASNSVRLGNLIVGASYTGFISAQGGTQIFNCIAGDTLAIQAYQSATAGGRTIHTDTTFNRVSIVRVGN